MVDKNVYITPLAATGHTYYFPACNVFLNLNKQLTELERN